MALKGNVTVPQIMTCSAVTPTLQFEVTLRDVWATWDVWGPAVLLWRTLHHPGALRVYLESNPTRHADGHETRLSNR